jgi:glycine hydroxymethyltransferase
MTSSTPRKIIFICTGNLCRSPMAEGILKARWAALGRNDISVSSMGIHGLNHQPATEPARRICREHGIDISTHFSRPLDFDEMSRSDLMFALEMVHKDFIRLFQPHLAEKTFLLGSWPLKDSPKGNIRDPMGGGPKDYANAFETISRKIENIIPYLQAMFA